MFPVVLDVPPLRERPGDIPVDDLPESLARVGRRRPLTALEWHEREAAARDLGISAPPSTAN